MICLNQKLLNIRYTVLQCLFINFTIKSLSTSEYNRLKYLHTRVNKSVRICASIHVSHYIMYINIPQYVHTIYVGATINFS